MRPRLSSARGAPLVGQQIVEGGGRVGADAAEDVGQVRDGLDRVRLAGGGEGVEAGDVVAGLLVTDKEEVLAAESHHAQGGFAPVVVGRNAGVVEEAGELVPA